ncbi:EscU/YscU/HrcU family type III secretion system export apparatus switch protein [Buchnera aphidicola]|uniref:EscU/YscU/HrcU family type III secretion system export apparatus switch protein n=1 Tax=Buchnera aphidicola TaxID=9 RepID=UPI00165156E4|nr:EscU/YscU/HrcU family type III secretion system export apparatus switch protein [Buchnera aphidicola]
MNSDDIQDKTEEPTYNRIKQVKKKGIQNYSNELNFFILLISLFITGFFYSNKILIIFFKLMFYSFSFNHFIIKNNFFSYIIMIELYKIFFLFSFFYILIFFLILTTSFFFNGFYIQLNFIKFNNFNINFLKIIDNIFSIELYINFLKIFLKLLIFFIIFIFYFKIYFIKIINLSYLPYFSSFILGIHIIINILILLFISIIPIVIFDIFWKKFNYYKTLKMSRKEIEDEYKNEKGNSDIKKKIKK